jgi:serine/threonine-protein kinase
LTDAAGAPASADDAAAFSETWHLRSACSANGCIATAVTGGQYPVKNLVFDNVAGRWLAVSTSRAKCINRENDEVWDVVSLQPRPDGTMSGEATESWMNGCFNKRTVTFTRTADTDISLLPDPATLPPRVDSPAEVLHGRYDALATYANGGVNRDTYGVRTDCVRTGDRCMSFFIAVKEAKSEVFVFGNGTWTRNQECDGQCSSGGTDHAKLTATLPLPQPPQDPITLLTGHGYVEILPPAKCPSQARTGD